MAHSTDYSYWEDSLRPKAPSQTDGSSLSFTYVQDAQGRFRVHTVSNAQGETTTVDYLDAFTTRVRDALARHLVPS